MLQYFARQLQNLRHGEEKQFIMHGFDITNRAVYDKATSDPDMLGMGTTGVCVYLYGPMAHIVHAGDSRAYLFRSGEIRQLTRDHSMVQQLVDSGQNHPGAGRHPSPEKPDHPARWGSRPTLCPSTTAAKWSPGMCCCSAPTV